MIHQLKTKKEYFEAVRQGRKKFEVRRNDRGFKVGDYLALNEVDDSGVETDFSIIVRVVYILDNEEYCKQGFVVMGITLCCIEDL